MKTTHMDKDFHFYQEFIFTKVASSKAN